MDATKNEITNQELVLTIEKLWGEMKAQAVLIATQEPTLSPLIDDVILSRNSFAEALAARIARKLAREDMLREQFEPVLLDVFQSSDSVLIQVMHDLKAINERDPACRSLLEPLLFFKGFLAITTYRAGHHLWNMKRRYLALYIQSVCAEVFAVDIHPAARVGAGILLDHATSLVIGETAIVDDNVSIMHEVTLGGTGKVEGDRHPVVKSGVLIGAGAKLLGRIEIGHCAKIGAGSVVLSDVKEYTTVAGIPAVIVGKMNTEEPATCMDQSLNSANL